MKIKNVLSGGVAVVATTLLLLTGAASASADESVNATDESTQVCWGDVATGNTACAATDEELAVKIYEEFNTVIVGDAPASLKLPDSQRTAADEATAAPLASYLLGKWYADANYSGAAWVHTTTATSTPCAIPQDYLYGQVDNLALISLIDPWNNRISSFQGYNHCGFQLWSGNNITGSSYGPVLNAPNLGAFDNQANSLRMRYV